MAGTITIEEFRQRIGESRVNCKICNFRGHSLVEHLASKHNMTPGQYKQQYGKNSPLASPIIGELIRQMDRKSKDSERFEDFLDAFQKSGGTDALFAALKPKFGQTKPENKIFVPKVNQDFLFDPKMVKPVAFGLLRGKNIYIEGPTGCGKTDGVEQIHAMFELPVKRVNMNGDVTVANFIGSKQADPARGTYFQHGSLPLAMKAGITLLIDEIDYMPPSIAAVLNSVLEGKRVIFLPETNETIHAEPGFNIVATGNTGGKGDTTGVYTATEVLNTAFLDRFAIKLTMDYLPLADEIRMLQSRFSGKDSGRIQKYVQAASHVRKAFQKGQLPMTISTRKLIELLEMEEALEPKEAINCAILNWLDEDNRNTVTKILDNCGVSYK